MRGVLRKIIDRIDVSKLSIVSVPSFSGELPQSNNNGHIITQAWHWPRISSFLGENDI